MSDISKLTNLDEVDINELIKNVDNDDLSINISDDYSDEDILNDNFIKGGGKKDEDNKDDAFAGDEAEEDEGEEEDEDDEAEEDEGEEDEGEEDEGNDDIDDMNKVEQNINQDILNIFHPEINQINYKELLTLSQVTKNKKGVIVDPLHTTYPFLTRYEKAKILGLRAKQINHGSKPFVTVPNYIIDGHTIALMELNKGKIPYIIRRPMPNGGSEYWKVKDLQIID